MPGLHIKVAARCHCTEVKPTPILLPINILEDFTKPSGTQSDIGCEQRLAQIGTGMLMGL